MTLLLNNEQVAQVLDAGLALETLEAAYVGYQAGTATCVPRIDLQVPTDRPDLTYQFGMTVGAAAGGYLGLRIKSDMTFEDRSGGVRRKGKYCVRPGLYCGLVLLFSTETGALVAILNDGLLQSARVGADSALGAKYMARADSRVLGILGAGGMARAHLAAFLRVRPIERVRIFSPTPANREAFARDARETYGIDAIAVDDPRDVFRGADIVASCASAIGPVVLGEYLEPGTHVTCIGGTLDRAASDRVDVALRLGNAPAPVEMPDMRPTEECLTYPVGHGGKVGYGGTRRYADIAPERYVMFADLLRDPTRGRRGDEQITFSERGNIHGLQFYAIAGAVYERAAARGLGMDLPAEWFLQTVRN